jgi:PAS domain-containing protein
VRSLPVLATQALHRSEQELQLAMESAGMGIRFYDLATVLVFADEQMDRIFGVA